MPSDTLEEDHPDIFSGGASDKMWAAYDTEVSQYGGRDVWTGEWPGTAECREYGLWSRWVGSTWPEPGGRWVKCAATDEGAGPNLNALNAWGGFVWDRTARKWRKP
jgi:hypothetical protein